VNEVKSFRKALQFAGWPAVLRRPLWWLALNLGRQRANFFGTFAVSVYSALGAESLHPISPCTTLLNYGVFRPSGTCDVRIIYDHRVMDGATIARALARLEAVLTTEIIAELQAEAKVQSAAA
jgi:hypothetical protein